MTRKRHSYRGAAAALVVLSGACASGVSAQPVANVYSVAATLASDYFAYGQSQTNGGPAWRIAGDYSHASGFFAGGYVTNVEFEREAAWRRPRDFRVNYYAGYRQRGDRWSSHVNLSRYVYPDLEISYDYTQLAAGIAYRDRFFASGTYSDDWLGIGRRGYTYELGLIQPLPRRLELGVDIGRARLRTFLGGSFTYWNVGVSRAIDRFAVDLRYHRATVDRYTLLGDPGGNRWALSVTYAIAPRDR